ncbi:MAG: YlxR family protein [Actinobacteria bacterium]|nr:YlxR family protein [Actinomycetota bacterium]
MISRQSTRVRSCVDCRKRENPTALIRTVCRDGKLIPDPLGISPGRGAWVHSKCAARAVERGVFGRALRLKDAPDGSDLIAYIEVTFTEQFRS